MKRSSCIVWFAATATLLLSADARAQQRAQYEALVATHAKANLVPEALVHRVIVRESKYHPDLIGRGGTIGLMQIKLGTARGLGYTGDAKGLRDPETNLAYGIKYLAGAFRAANGDHDRAVRYYAGGYYGVAKQQRLEHIKHATEPVLASTAPKAIELSKEAPAPSPETAVAPVEAAAQPKEAVESQQAVVAPKEIAAKPRRRIRRHSKKLAEAGVPRPPAAIPGSANTIKPR